MDLWTYVCQQHWNDALFDTDDMVTNRGLHTYCLRLLGWMQHQVNQETKEYQFAKLRVLMIEEMLKANSASAIWALE